MKPKITVDMLYQVIEKVFETYNYKIEDISNDSYNGKNIIDALDIKYYKFKHRLTNRIAYIEKFKERVDKAFCLVELNPNLNIEFTNKTFLASPSISLTYLVPTSKVPLLEDFLCYCNSNIIGESINVTVGETVLKAKIFMGSMIETDVQTSSFMGEASICNISISFVLSEDILGFENYSFKLGTDENNLQDFKPSYFGNDRSMIPKSTPFMNANSSSAQINLSNTQVFSFKFYAKNDDVCNDLADMALEENIDNNKEYFLEITRNGKARTHKVVLANVSSIVEDGVGQEVFTATFTKRGKR